MPNGHPLQLTYYWNSTYTSAWRVGKLAPASYPLHINERRGVWLWQDLFSAAFSPCVPAQGPIFPKEALVRNPKLADYLQSLLGRGKEEYVASVCKT